MSSPTAAPPAPTFGGADGGTTSFSTFFSQPGGLGPWIQDVARFVAVGVVVVGVMLVVRDLARGRGAAACKDLVGALLAAAVLSDLSLLGLATNVAIEGVGLAVTTLSSIS